MDDEVVKLLRNMLSDRGFDVAADSKAFRNLAADYAPRFRKERKNLETLIIIGFTNSLLKSDNIQDLRKEAKRDVKKLIKQYNIPAEDAAASANMWYKIIKFDDGNLIDATVSTANHTGSFLPIKKLVMAAGLVAIVISLYFARAIITPSQPQSSNTENTVTMQNDEVKSSPEAATSEKQASVQNAANESTVVNSQPQPEQSPAAETKPQQTAAESKPTEQPQSQPSEQEAAPARPAKQESPSVSAIVSQITGGKTTPPHYSEGGELYKKARAEADSMTPSEALNKSDEYISNTNDEEKHSQYRIVQIAFLESAAARGMEGAIAHLARFYDGKDDEKYIAWAKYGANLGDSSSINRLAYSYERGYNGLQKNLQTALKLAEAAKAAAKGRRTEEVEANMLIREIKGQIEDDKLGISGN